MPQLDFSTYASQIFWLLLGFIILYLFMARVALPRIGAILTNREERISSDLRKAEELKQEAVSTKADFASALNEAKISAAQIMDNVHSQTAKTLASRHAQLDKTLEQQQQQAEKSLAKLSAETKQKMNEASVDLICEITEKLIGKKLEASYVKEKLLQNSSN